jgi:hypothetical protein
MEGALSLKKFLQYECQIDYISRLRTRSFSWIDSAIFAIFDDLNLILKISVIQ